nr:MAG TPA: hypothetical protein [Caudoviricetes sp.]
MDRAAQSGDASLCVLVWDGKELKLVSWNNAGDNYGNTEWALR